MAINFTFVGKMSIGKDTEKKQAYVEKEHVNEKTGEVKGHSRRLNLIVKCGEDTFFPSVGGYMGNIIYSLSKADNSSITFPASKRNEFLSQVADFKKYVFVDKANEVRYEFTTEYDLALCVHQMLQDEKYKDTIFKVSGEVEYSTYTSDGIEKTFKNYKVTRIYAVASDSEQQAIITTDFYVAEDCFDESKVESDSLLTILGYVPVYDSNKKKLCGDGTRGYFEKYEFDLSTDEAKREKQIEALKRKFAPNTENGEGYLSMTGLHVKLINRTDSVEFDESQLSEDELLDVELGITTMEELKEFYSGGKSNSYTQRQVMCGFKPKFLGGTQKSMYTIADLTSDGTKKEELFIDFGGSVDDIDDIFGV